MDTMHGNIKKAFVEAIKEDLVLANNILNDTAIRETDFYKTIWGDSAFTRLKEDINSLIASLSATPFKQTLTASSDLYILDSLLAFYLDENKWKFYKTVDKEEGKYYSITLKIIDLANDFLINYYNRIYVTPENAAYRKLNVENYQEIIRQANELQKIVHEMPATPKDSFTIATLNKAYRLHESISQFLQGNLLSKLLKAPWTRSWIWKTGGYIRFNPLPFTIEESINEPSKTDSAKLRYYNRYVEATLEKRIATDSVMNITTFKEELAQYGKGKELFTDLSKQKKALNDNEAARKRILQVSRVVNNVKVPLAVPNAYYILYSSPNEEDKDIRRLQAFSIDDKLVFPVHNLPKGHRSVLIKKKADLIKDQSDVQIAIDEHIDQIAQIALALQPALGFAIKQITALNGPFNLKGPSTLTAIRPSVVADISDNRAEFLHEGKIRFEDIKSSDDFWTVASGAAKNVIMSQLNPLNSAYSFMKLPELQSIEFDSGLFMSVKADYSKAIESLFIPKKFSKKQVQKMIEEVTEKYFKQFLEKNIAPVVFNVINKDNSYIEIVKKVVKGSTVPPGLLKAESDNEPVYHSEIHYADVEDSTKKYEYDLVNIKDKDSLVFGRISYSTSKRRRIQFSSGLVYTITPVIRNNVTEENGQITVDSKEQRYGLYVALHFYPFNGGLFVQDKEFVANRKYGVANRINFMLGVSFPDPLENILFGLGYDFGPGIKLNTGLHFYRYDKFEVFNNAITNKSSIYRIAVPFVSLGIDPASLVKALNIFNK
ncbi:hypothetical protein [Longitalea luteola]|uniref:hypothetical protein n=1 Tax=Longitalea luteola TaxID=2812563 RepID=UPI001A96AD25|nr:hypothetical protein [Longitalea luteola]